MKTVLMVAEKPSLSQSIAKILSNGNMTSKKGVSSSCMVHEYTGTFRGEQARFKMTAVCGHVMSLDFSGHFNNWDAVEPVELFSALAKKKEANPNLHMVYHLQVAARGCDYVVLWLDCDKEGENICFEVIDAVQKEVRSSKGKVFYRAHFSAITDSEIKKAMSNLGEPNENESLSVDARQELDLRVGCAFTRFQTKFFQGKYGDLDSSLISYGPCQTPTLAFCVARHDIIQSFKPEPFWKLHVVLKPNVTLEWQRGRIFDKEVGNLFCNLVKGQSVATVIKVQEKEKRKQPPIALNTVELLRVASSGLGIGPQQTMQIAERLYIQGYISYPRTETTSYPASFDLIAPLKQQTTGAGWGAYVRQLLSDGIAKPRKGADAGDHPPITPMRSASQHELQGEAWRLYDYIVRHFISTVSKDCVYTLKTMTVNVNNEVFTCEGKTVVEAGFTEVMYHQAISQEESVPNFKEMQKIEIKEAKLLERFTFPPDYLTESELITLMEKHGIGTDASIPIHINNISQRNYVTVENGRKLIPTSLGVVLVHGYHKIDPELALPTIRAAVERQLAKIADGTADYEAVLDYSVEMFEKKFEYFTRNIENMDELFECSFTKLSESGKPMSRCGKCRRFMKYITAKPYRLHCSHCDETYALPQDGYVKLYQELRCPLDDFELLLWTRGGKTKERFGLSGNDNMNNSTINTTATTVVWGPVLTGKSSYSMSEGGRQPIVVRYTNKMALVVHRWRTNFINKMFKGIVNNLALGVNGMLLLILLCILIWLVERRTNDAISTQPIQGLGTTVWLSVVTMTTIGYGDVIPQTGVGKLLCVVIVICGIVVMNVSIASISNSVFGTVDFSLEDKNLAVLKDSHENAVAVKKFHANVSEVNSYTEVLELVRNNEVFGALVNYDVLAWWDPREKFLKESHLRIALTYEETIPVYFRTKWSSPWVQEQYITCQQARKYVGNNIKKKHLQVNVLDYEKGWEIFNNIYIQILLGTAAFLLLVTFFVEWCLYVKRKESAKFSSRENQNHGFEMTEKS